MAAVAGLIGWSLALGMGARREIDQLIASRDNERGEAERAIGRLRHDLQVLESREKERSEVFLFLPDVLRQMLAAQGRRDVYPLVLKMIEELFHPVECALLVARASDRRLGVAASHGLASGVANAVEIELGQGRVGYVAECRMVMDDADFRKTTAIVKRQVEAGPRGLRADVVAPIEYEGQLLGVISMGQPRHHHGQEKRLLKMVAELSGVALTHVNRFRTTEEAANVDGLTGCYNKRYFEKRLGDEINKAERDNGTLSLLILDIDHFKNYNDTHGHQEGDRVLKVVGKILKSSVRDDDTAARYGGEEFVVLYPGASKSAALRLADMLRRAIEAHVFGNGDADSLRRVTISGGVATFPEDARNGSDLLRYADHALYDAKAGGRNRIEAAQPNYLT